VNGVLVIDKPRGPTSHDVVAQVRRKLKTRHVGHAGTLDPMATGVLVVAVGDATKLVPWLTADDKTYVTTIRLGIETDTLDAEGKETAREVVRFDRAQLEAALDAERARTLQVPPAFSAIKIGGQRAHELARAGVETELPERPVAVRALALIEARADELDLHVAVSKGYFVRSLARDLARALGTAGHLTSLRRVRSGGFAIEDAITIEAVAGDALLPTSVAATRALPVSTLDDAGVRAASFGQRVAPEHIRDPRAGPSAWVDERAQLVAIGECEPDGTGRVLRGFPRSQ
jgi:tRNA pseudouridine55 synthase